MTRHSRLVPEIARKPENPRKFCVLCFAEAFELTEAERAELAHDLVSSLDGPPDQDAAQEWDAEISRRLAEVDAGAASWIDRKEFSKRMRDRMRR
jgi:putative addiction module component (TIGR02574 family)